MYPDLGDVQDAGFEIEPTLGTVSRGHISGLTFNASPELDRHVGGDGLGDIDRRSLPAAVLVLLPLERGEDWVGLADDQRAGQPLPGKSRDNAEGDCWQSLERHDGRRS